MRNLRENLFPPLGIQGPGQGLHAQQSWTHWVQQVLEHHGHQINTQAKQSPQSTGFGAVPHLTHGATHATQHLATHQLSHEAHDWQSNS